MFFFSSFLMLNSLFWKAEISKNILTENCFFFSLHTASPLNKSTTIFSATLCFLFSVCWKMKSPKHQKMCGNKKKKKKGMAMRHHNRRNTRSGGGKKELEKDLIKKKTQVAWFMESFFFCSFLLFFRCLFGGRWNSS